jgi:hypothetical protein
VLNAIPATAGSVGTTYLAAGSVTQSILGTGVAGNGPSFSATLSTGSVTVANSTFTKIPCNVEEWDTANCYDNATNYRFTPNVAGYYQISAQVSLTGSTTAGNNTISIFKNGTQYRYGSSFGGASAAGYNTISSLVYCNGSTDYLEIYYYAKQWL